MQAKFICHWPDGRVEIVGSGRLEDLQKQFGPTFTVADMKALAMRRRLAQGATFIEMPDGWEPPADRTFRNAWRVKGKSIEGVEHPECAELEVDMPAAREIHRGWLRRKRIGKLAELDVEYQKADEQNDNAKKRLVATEKQRLRDLPSDPRIDAAKTPDELKAVTP